MNNQRAVFVIRFLLGFLLVGTPATAWSPEGVDDSLYAALLAKYVRDGVVDYRGFKNEEKQLDAYLKVLEETDTTELSRDEQLALYINAYNATTIKLILSRYPHVKSIWDLGSRILPWKNPFKKKIVHIEGETISLDDLEHGIIRPRFKDPRIHFAVNCASKSCPPLISEPYRGATINAQLNASTRGFLNDPARNRLQGNTLYVSMIFDWYAEDFDNDVVGFCIQFADTGLKARLIANRDMIRVEYLDYDWSLNGNKTLQSAV